MKPVNGGVVVKTEKVKEKETASGIILREDVKVTALANGPVISVAEGSSVSPGDVVHFSRYKGVRFELDGVEHALIKEDDILAID